MWDVLLKVEISYESKPVVEQILGARLNDIPYDYNFDHLAQEREDQRLAENTLPEGTIDPLPYTTPLGKYTLRGFSDRPTITYGG